MATGEAQPWRGIDAERQLTAMEKSSRAMTLHEDEVVAPFSVGKAATPMASSFRSTWLTASIRALRERNLLERYLAALPEHHRAVVLDSVAGVWLDVEVAMAHYRACDGLGLPPGDQVAIGREVTTFAHATAYAMALRLAKGVGVTPWMCFSIQKRLWKQVWRGGDVATFKVGPKEARVEIAGWPCSAIEYPRRAMNGVLLGQTELFCSKAYVREIANLCTDSTLGFRISWF